MKYETLKVFDCQDMPEDVKAALFEHEREALMGRNNDSYIPWGIADENFDDENDPWALRKKKIDAWLISSGARGPTSDDPDSDDYCGEEVLIKYWW